MAENQGAPPGLNYILLQLNRWLTSKFFQYRRSFLLRTKTQQFAAQGTPTYYVTAG